MILKPKQQSHAHPSHWRVKHSGTHSSLYSEWMATGRSHWFQWEWCVVYVQRTYYLLSINVVKHFTLHPVKSSQPSLEAVQMRTGMQLGEVKGIASPLTPSYGNWLQIWWEGPSKPLLMLHTTPWRCQQGRLSKMKLPVIIRHLLSDQCQVQSQRTDLCVRSIALCVAFFRGPFWRDPEN